MRHRRRHVTILVANLPAERDRRVIREARALEAAGYEVTVIAPRGEPDLTHLPGSRVRLRPYPVRVQGSGIVSFAFEFAWSFTWIALRLAGEVIRGRAHAVQVCNPPDVYWPLALLMRLLGRPWVFDHHDLCPEIYATRAGGRPNRLALGLLRAMEWLTLRTATEVVATNESFRAHAVRRGVPQARITVVRNGPAAREIGAAAAPAGSPHRIVYLGVLGPQDNVAALVHAAAELVRRRGRTGWRVTIAGDGETLPALSKLVADSGLADLVEFTGWLQAEAVDELLRSATLAVQPDAPTPMNQLSTMAKTVEYLGRGVPVVAADLVETRRTAGDAAVYVPHGTPEEFAAAIDALLDDPDRRQRMREAGLARFTARLSWDQQVQPYLEVWQRLLPTGAGAAVPPPRAADRPAPPDRPTTPPDQPATPAPPLVSGQSTAAGQPAASDQPATPDPDGAAR